MARVPPSEATRKPLQAMMSGTEELDLSKFVREGVRLLIEEALEAEVSTSLGRGYYEHGAEEVSPRYRNGYRLGRIKSAEGDLEFGVPQFPGGLEPWRAQVREALTGRIRHVRPKLCCAHCCRVMQLPAPSRPIERGMPAAGLLAQVIVAKYADHCPLYRQQGIYRRGAFSARVM